MKRSIAAPRAARFDLLLIGAVATVADVVADGIVEQDRVLRDDSDRGAKALLGDRDDRLAIDQDST